MSAPPDGPHSWVGRALEGGRYTIVEHLGGGGMGQVYRAQQHDMGRDVAIKLMSYQVRQHPEARSRFVREARLTGRINHPGIVTVHHYGVEEHGVMYLVMEYLRGVTLAELLRVEGPLPLSRVARVVDQICDALYAAHRQGVIHRDLKPANVIVLDEGPAPDTLKVLDFGLARSLLPSAEFTALTQSGKMFGTPAYMPPEVAMGRNCDARGDVYSLGTMVYEMLAGRTQFAHVEALMVPAAHARDPVPPLPSHIHPVFQRLVVERMLAKDPDQRVPSIGEARALLAAAFQTATQGSPSAPADATENISFEPADLVASVGLPSPPDTSATALSEPAGVTPGPSVSTVDISAPPVGRWRLPAALVALALGGAVAASQLGDERGSSAPLADAMATAASQVTPDAASASPHDAGGAPDARALDAAQPDATAPDASLSDTPKPGPTRLTFTSAPSGAAVAVNGARVCAATPCESSLPLEETTSLQIRVTKSGYRPFTKTLADVSPGSTSKVEARLTPHTPPLKVQLDIRSTPKGATVKLNGKRIGVTPLKRQQVVPRGKKVRVELTKPGYVPYEHALDPKGGIRLSERLVPAL